MAQARRRTCPTPGKIRYRTEHDAQCALIGIVIRANRGRRSAHERRAYQCRCGGWHLTSKTRSTGGRA